jgi:NAD+ kinase
MRNIFLFPNPNRDPDFKLTLETASLLHRFGIEPVLQSDIELRAPAYVKRLPLIEGERISGMVICLGGDGTILRIAPVAAEEDKPILGINAGKVGFLAELEKDELSRLDQILQGNYSIDARAMLDIKLEHGDEIIYRGAALNDAVVTGNEGIKVITLDLWVDGHFITAISGDGLIASTPTGSSAYSMSAGGPLVEPCADTILVTPICSHSLFSKSLVLSGSSEIVIKNASSGTPFTPGIVKPKR